MERVFGLIILLSITYFIMSCVNRSPINAALAAVIFMLTIIANLLLEIKLILKNKK